jgi:hypothetical protein
MHVNKRVSHRASIGPLIDGNRRILSSDLEKANAFNTYFASVGVIDDNITPPSETATSHKLLTDILIDFLRFCLQKADYKIAAQQVLIVFHQLFQKS